MKKITGAKLNSKNILSRILNKYPLVFIIFLYTLANLLMILNNGVFWDDWCIYNMSYSGLRDIYVGIGIPFMEPITYLLQNITMYPALLYHFLIFVFGVSEIIIFYYIIKNLINERESIFILTTFFALVPYNNAKILMSCFQYNFGFLIFLLAAFFFIKFIPKRYFLFRIISLLLFFASFALLNSTLVLMLGLVFFIVIYPDKISINKLFLKKVLKKILLLSDFIILPFFFWFLKILYFKPTWLYESEGYNSITTKNIYLYPFYLIKTIDGSVLGLFHELFSTRYSSGTYVLFFLIIYIFLYLSFRNSSFWKHELKNKKGWIITGIYFFILGSISYNLVGKIPSFDLYETRHQILLVIGISILLVWALELFRNERIKRNVTILLLSFFILTTINQNVKFLSSWFKQISLENKFKNSKIVKNNKSFVVLDNTIDLNEVDCGYSFYCFNGMLKKVFNDQTRLMITLDDNNFYEQKKWDIKQYIARDNYNMNMYKNTGKFDYYLLIENKKNAPLDKSIIFKLLFEKYLDKNKFNEQANNLLELKYIPYN